MIECGPEPCSPSACNVVNKLFPRRIPLRRVDDLEALQLRGEILDRARADRLDVRLVEGLRRIENPV
jgi:hypothetical protein